MNKREGKRIVEALYGENGLTSLTSVGQFCHVKKEPGDNLIIRSDYPGRESTLFLPNSDFEAVAEMFASLQEARVKLGIK